MDLTYRSPFEGDTELACYAVDDGICVWSYQGIAVAMIPPLPVWTPGLRSWYTARRDANLMGYCPLCGTEMPAVMAGTVHGEMRHENDCAVIEPEWWHEYGRQFSTAHWVQA